MTDPIQLGGDANAKRGFTWDLALTVFMRVMGVAWLAKGLFHFAVVLDLTTYGASPFATSPLATQAFVAIIGILDLVAAVGLWLLAPWGGVIWLVAALGHALVALALPEVAGYQPLLAAGLGLLVVAYLVVTFLAVRQGES